MAKMESQRDIRMSTVMFRDFAGVFRGISLSGVCTASLDLVETDLRVKETLWEIGLGLTCWLSERGKLINFDLELIWKF